MAFLSQRINVQDATSMPTVKMESACVMEVITELGLWENVSVWEVCGNGDQRSSNFWYNLELFIVANRECTMHYMF